MADTPTKSPSPQIIDECPRRTCGDTKWGHWGDLRCRLEPNHPGSRLHEGTDKTGRLVRW